MIDQNWSFLHQNEDFDQTYVNTGQKSIKNNSVHCAVECVTLSQHLQVEASFIM